MADNTRTRLGHIMKSRVEEYIDSGRENQLVDPDPDQIESKRKHVPTRLKM